MEQGLNSLLRESFSLEEKDIRTYSPLSLAYIGDSIYDLIVRSIIVDKGNANVNKLHKSSVKYVSAKAQCFIVKSIYDELTDEEKDIFRRGKNTKIHTVAKNASITEYRYATGFEAVLGYLYLTDNFNRLIELIKKAMEKADER